MPPGTFFRDGPGRNGTRNGNGKEARKLLSAFKVCIDILSRLLKRVERERDFFTIVRYGNGKRNEKVNGPRNETGNLSDNLAHAR